MKSKTIRETLNFVILAPGKVVKKFTVNSEEDMRRHFPFRSGRPVIGPNVFIELTHKELAAQGKPPGYKRLNYMDCLRPAKVAVLLTYYDDTFAVA